MSGQRAGAPEETMEADDVLNLYEWTPGACFQCARTNLDTAVVATLHPASSPPQPVRACRICLLILEDERRVAAERAGRGYEPGHVGEACGATDRSTSDPS